MSGSSRLRRPLVAVAAVLALATAVQCFTPSNAGLQPQRIHAYDRTHYMQLAEEPVAGTVVLIHGCGPGAPAFFPFDPTYCPECQGFPEYLSMTKQALARGYHVLALQANDVGSNCWSSVARDGRVDDRPDVVATVQQFLRNHSMEGMPLYFQGYSSGGTMCLKLPSYLLDSGDSLRIDGILPTDAAPGGGFNAEDREGKMKRGLDFPPTLYIAMLPGKATMRAPAQIDFLRANGVPADLIVSPLRQLTPTYFSDRIATVTPEQSEQLVAALLQAGALDPEGYLLPGYWLGVVAPQLPWLTADGLVFTSVAMEMDVAVGTHQNLGDYFTVGLAWLESAGEADVQALVQELAVTRPGHLTIDRRQAGAQSLPPALAPSSAA